MKFFQRFFLCLLLCAPIVNWTHGSPGVLLGIDAGTSQTNVTAFTSFLGTAPRFIVNFFNSSSRSALNNDVPFELSQFQTYANPVVWSFPLITGTSGETLANAASGSYDSSWTTALNEILTSRTNDKTIILRVNWEMNGVTFFPWYCTPDQTNFNASWQRFVNLARSLSSKFVFLWCPTQGQDLPAPCYPGDSYVDIIGMDAYYDITQDHAGASATFGFFKTETTGFNWMYTFAALHHKPFSMPEWGINTDTDGATYINLMANEFKIQGYYLQSYSDAISEWTLSNNQFPNAGTAYITAFNP
jgi:beta-mannanase